MANVKSAKNCFESSYGGGWITVAQRLAEMACERLAGNVTLSSQFWQVQPWDKIFRREVTHANRILSTPFAAEAVMRAWISREGRGIRSLGAPFFRPIVEIEQSRLNIELKQLEQSVIPETSDIMQTPRPYKRFDKSIREKLISNGQDKTDKTDKPESN